MNRFGILILVWVLGSNPLWSSGTSEDPQEIVTRTFNLAPWTTLTIRGQIEFVLVPGTSSQVKVETSRALMDQLSVSVWWGAATVAVESGLRGPRERGIVRIWLESTSVEELVVADNSRGTVVWPAGRGGVLRVQEGSTVTAEVSGPRWEVASSWRSKVTLRGSVDFLTATLRHQGQVDTLGLRSGETQVDLGEASFFEAGPTVQGRGRVRQGSTIVTPSEAEWSALVIEAGSRWERSETPSSTGF